MKEDQINHLNNVIISSVVIILLSVTVIGGIIDFFKNMDYYNVLMKAAKIENPDPSNEVFIGFSNLLKNIKLNETNKDSITQCLLEDLQVYQEQLIKNSLLRLEYVIKINVIEGSKKEVKKRIPIYFFTALGFFLLLLLIRGWDRIKKHLHPFPSEKLNKYSLDRLNDKGIQFFFGAQTLSYGFFKKKIILGREFIIAKADERQFILFHEISHLMYGDSIVKNLLINTRKLFLPLFLLFSITLVISNSATFSAFVLPEGSSLLMDEEVRGMEFSEYQIRSVKIFHGYIFFILVRIISILLLLFWSLKLLTEWFSRIKEYFADGYAYFGKMESLPMIDVVEDDFHPSNAKRLDYLSNRPLNESMFPVLFFCLLLLNLGGSMPVINEEVRISILCVFIFFLMYDASISKIHSLSWKNFFLLFALAILGISYEILLCEILVELGGNSELQRSMHQQSITFTVIYVISIFFYCLVMQKNIILRIWKNLK